MCFKICANLSFMFQDNVSLIERYSLAKKLGFKAVECAFPYEYSIVDLQRKIKEENLTQVLINVYPGNILKGEQGFAALVGKQDEFERSIDISIHYANSLKCNKIHIMSGLVEHPTVINDEIYKKNLLYATKIFEKHQIIGLIEPINRYSLPRYYMNSFENAVSIIKEINSPNLKLMLDIFHLQHMQGDLTNSIRNYIPFTAHIQIAQVPYRNEPNTLGEINYLYIFKLLKELQYSEWIGTEYKPTNITQPSLEWMNMLNL